MGHLRVAGLWSVLSFVVLFVACSEAGKSDDVTQGAPGTVMTGGGWCRRHQRPAGRPRWCPGRAWWGRWAGRRKWLRRHRGGDCSDCHGLYGETCRGGVWICAERSPSCASGGRGGGGGAGDSGRGGVGGLGGESGCGGIGEATAPIATACMERPAGEACGFRPERSPSCASGGRGGGGGGQWAWWGRWAGRRGWSRWQRWIDGLRRGDDARGVRRAQRLSFGVRRSRELQLPGARLLRAFLTLRRWRPRAVRVDRYQLRASRAPLRGALHSQLRQPLLRGVRAHHRVHADAMTFGGAKQHGYVEGERFTVRRR